MKHLLTLLSTWAIPLLVLLIANTVQAQPELNSNLEPVFSTRDVNLNFVSDSLKFTNPSLNNPIRHTTGCGCASCSQALKQILI